MIICRIPKIFLIFCGLLLTSTVALKSPAHADPREESLFVCSDNFQLSTPEAIAKALAATISTQEGEKYYEGDGVPKDFAKAAELYRQGAELDYYASQFALGVMYASGEGVSQDYAEAAKWTRKSAEQGFAPAQLNLGLLYAKGNGVPQDFVQMYMWFIIAEARAIEAVENSPKLTSDSNVVRADIIRAQLVETAETARKFRDKFEDALKAADISKAKKLANEWLANCREPPD